MRSFHLRKFSMKRILTESSYDDEPITKNKNHNIEDVEIYAYDIDSLIKELNKVKRKFGNVGCCLYTSSELHSNSPILVKGRRIYKAGYNNFLTFSVG